MHPGKLFCFLAVILLPASLFCQSTPYYLAAGLSDFEDQELRGSNTIYVTYPNKDSLILSPELDTYAHSAIYNRKQGEFFMRRTRVFSYPATNYACIFEKGVVLIQENGSYLIFLKDQNQAGQAMAMTDKSPFLAIRDSLKMEIDKVNKPLIAANQAAAEKANKKDIAETKAILSGYLKGLRSKLSDPVLERKIVKWSHNPDTRVYLAADHYSIVRNALGVVLRKTITGVIVYPLDGKCYLQWRTFGYESLGGGQFSTDLSTYNSSDYTFRASGPAGSKDLEMGTDYEVNCNR